MNISITQDNQNDNQISKFIRKKNRVTEAKAVDKRTVAYKRRILAVKKGTVAMLDLQGT